MTEDGVEENAVYIAVVNHEEQHSIWRAEKSLPLGWRPIGTVGTKAEVLAYIETVWSDLRPLSVRHWEASQRKEQGRLTLPATQLIR